MIVFGSVTCFVLYLHSCGYLVRSTYASPDARLASPRQFRDLEIRIITLVACCLFDIII
jgi:hypothetical protein